MQLTYTIRGLEQVLEISGDDIPELLRSAETQLQDRDPMIGANPYVPILIADGILNALAENAQSIHVGELSRPGDPMQTDDPSME